MNAGFWRLEDKAGLPLDAIHTGHVPQCMRPSILLRTHVILHAADPWQMKKNFSRQSRATSDVLR